ncbi:MAG: zinc-dependent metalloprotease family protein [Janthinobacterium lividum]
MRTLVRFTGVITFGLCSLQAFGVTLSPNAIGNSGNIPGSYTSVDFHTWDGDWSPTLTLPKSAPSGATITIYAHATYASNVVLANTDLPLRTTTMVAGDTLKFTYDSATARWLAKLPEYSPASVGAAVPGNGNKLGRYAMYDGNWVPLVTLPASAPPGAVMVVASRATWDSAVAPTNVLQASTMRMSTGEQYAYVFHPELKKWYLVASPVTAIGPQQTDGGAMRLTTRPRTELVLPTGTRPMSIRLPASAGDRDRIRISSAAADVQTIRNDSVDFTGTLQLRAGDAYEFMWIAEKSRWTLMSAPSRSYNAQAMAGGRVPDTTAPVTRVQAYDGNWLPTLSLPTRAKPGDRVVMASAATWSFQVVPGGAPASFASQPMTNGDTIAFVVDPAGRWTVETRTIAMLNVYADKVVAAYGSQAARARQLESFRLTNEALENSDTNFRLKMVGLMQHRDQGATLNDAVVRLRDDSVVQNERKRLGADAVYYEGAEKGCGLAWVNSSAYNMVATGSISCGTTVMRHEFGHNMGLSHGGEAGGSTPYATGYTLISDIMGGNSIPYFSTPALYEPTLGVAMGIAGKIDSVRAMNERSEQVSKFYP